MDRARYPDIDGIVRTAQACGLRFLRTTILFENQPLLLDDSFLELVRKKGYSMLHLITEEEYTAGLRALESALAAGPVEALAAGETLVWLARP
ncbi:MAG TPA: hypothetical protein VHP83_01640 [Aggregatilineaceae bacterium]|nr:hypothetical protein [Aggregatilineaceae bacterium]